MYVKIGDAGFQWLFHDRFENIEPDLKGFIIYFNHLY